MALLCGIRSAAALAEELESKARAAKNCLPLRRASSASRVFGYGTNGGIFRRSHLTMEGATGNFRRWTGLSWADGEPTVSGKIIIPS